MYKWLYQYVSYSLSLSLSLSVCVCVWVGCSGEDGEEKKKAPGFVVDQPLFFPPFNFLCWQKEGELQPGVVRRLNLRMRRQKERWTLMWRKKKRKKKRTVEKMRNRPNLEVVIPSLYILTIFVLSFFSHQVVQFSVLVVVVKQSKIQTSTDAWNAIDRFSPITVLATTTLLKLGTVDGAWIAKSHAKKPQNDPRKEMRAAATEESRWVGMFVVDHDETAAGNSRCCMGCERLASWKHPFKKGANAESLLYLWAALLVLVVPWRSPTQPPIHHPLFPVVVGSQRLTCCRFCSIHHKRKLFLAFPSRLWLFGTACFGCTSYHLGLVPPLRTTRLLSPPSPHLSPFLYISKYAFYDSFDVFFDVFGGGFSGRGDGVEVCRMEVCRVG